MSLRERLSEVIGSQNVTDDSAVMSEYINDKSFEQRIRPRLAVKVDSAQAVTDLVKWAHDTCTPLVPVSSAGPHRYGDTIPGVGGAVIVDMSGMKKIMNVDRRNRMVMVEPGVTFEELIPVVEKEGLCMLMPFLPRKGKSVVTAFLERTPITAPRFHWEPMDPTQCVEVIYGTGELMRSGSAALPDTLEKQWAMGKAQVRGMGPSQVDFTRLLQGAQGTLGIVTWASIKCRPSPTMKKLYFAGSSQVGPLMETAYQLTFQKLGEDMFILNNVNLAAVLGKNRSDIDAVADKLPPYILVFGIDAAGVLPEEKMAYQEAAAFKIVQGLGLDGLKQVLPGARAEDLAELINQPSDDPHWKIRQLGASADIFFLTTMDQVPGMIDTMNEIAAGHQYDIGGMGTYIQPTVQGGNCHVEFSLGYDPHSNGVAEKMKQLIRDGSEALAARGAFFSRPYGAWAEIAYRRDAQMVIGQRKLKQIFDPAGILNPGKLCF